MQQLSNVTRQIEGIGALADPIRRACYDYVCSQPEPVNRDQAAEGLDMARHTVKFHLDRLVEAGLLTAGYRRPEGRQGPGAGRPSKYYHRSPDETAVSLPARRYDLAGSVMAEAISRAAALGTPVLEALDSAASDVGTQLGVAAQSVAQCAADPLDTTCQVLAEQGYEPRESDGRVILANCPFHALVDKHTELVCSMNLALLGAVTEAVGSDGSGVGLCARLDPADGRCCVVIERERQAAARREPATTDRLPQ